jgi:hypothetical protein
MKYNLLGQRGPEGEINPDAPEGGQYIYDNPPGTGDNLGIQTSTTSNGSSSSVTNEAAMAIARSLFSFFPEAVLKEYAKSWVKYADPQLAIADVRTTTAWENEFGYLKREDGTLIMSEGEALSTKASYKETLQEVGITDTEQFNQKFKDLVSGEVSAAEFQQRVDLVYSQVVDQIPEVERLYRERYNINIDAPTVFGALIDEDISDKVLKGDIQTLQLQAQASIRGFTQNFARFEELKKAGLTVQQASQLYEAAQPTMELAENIGRELDITTLEEAAIGDVKASQRLSRVQAEAQTELGGVSVGAAKTRSGKITGLVEE